MSPIRSVKSPQRSMRLVPPTLVRHTVASAVFYPDEPCTPPLSASSTTASLPDSLSTPPSPLAMPLPDDSHDGYTGKLEYPSPSQELSGMMNRWGLDTPPRTFLPDSPLDADLHSPITPLSGLPVERGDKLFLGPTSFLPPTPWGGEPASPAPVPYRQPSWPSPLQYEAGPSRHDLFSPSYSMNPDNALQLSVEEDELTSTRWLAEHDLPADFTQRYILRDELGSGGFGFVCAAVMTRWNVTPGREVAVKFIFKHKIEDTEDGMVGDEPAECYILRHCSHRNIIEYIDMFEDGTFYILVQELHGDPWAAIHVRHDRDVARRLSASAQPVVRPRMGRRASHDLFEAIESTRFTEDEAKHIFRQIVMAVKYLHDLGIYHRDLKDENVVIDRNLHVKIIDFGSAVHENKLHPPNIYDSFRGTYSYASPEVLQGQYYLAGPCDIWSLGIIMSILLTGEQPFLDLDDALARRYRSRRAYSHSAQDLMDRMLRPDAHHRWTIGRISRHPWLSEPSVVSHVVAPSYWTFPSTSAWPEAPALGIVTGTASRARPEYH